MNRHIGDFLQVALEAFAVAAVRVFKHGELAFAVAAHLGEGVFDRQGAEVDGAEFGRALFGQVALGFGVDQVALQQKVAVGVGVKNVVVADADFVQAVHRRFGDFFDFGQVGQALGQIFADGRFLRESAGQAAQQQAGKSGQLQASGQ